MLTLVGRSLQRVGRLFGALLGILGVFQLVLVAVAASFEGARTFERLAMLVPSFMQQSFGAALTSFSGMATAGYFHPVVVMLVVQFTIYVATEPAGEIEWGLVDLVLARPLPRHWLVSRSLLMMIMGPAALTSTMVAGTWIGLWSLAPQAARWPDARVILLLVAHLVMLAWCFGGAALAAAAWAQRRGSAQAPVAVAAVILYLIEFLGASWDPARPLARASPFHYYQGTAILTGTADAVLDLSIMGAAAMVGIGLAYWQFGRRDL
jgi:hypothetical protein